VLGNGVKQPIDLCMRTYEKELFDRLLILKVPFCRLVFGAKALSHTNIRKGAAYGSWLRICYSLSHPATKVIQALPARPSHSYKLGHFDWKFQ
jgi:hypothetical protein